MGIGAGMTTRGAVAARLLGWRGAATSARDAHRRSARKPSTAAWLTLVVVVSAAYFVPRGISWNADSHLFLTASIVDRGSLNIDPLAHYTGDVAAAHGHYYADKAPGLSLAAVPVYAVLKYTLLGGKPYTALFAVPEAQRLDFFVRYLLALVFAAIPTGLIAGLLFSFLARLELRARWRAGVALVYALGTMAHPFADQFFSHQLAALLVFGGFVLAYRVRHGELDSRFALLTGLLLGYAIITEYPTAIIAGAIGLYALTTPGTGRRLGALLAAGAAPALLVGAAYNTLAFGGPFSQGYAHLAGPEVFRVGQAQGFMGIAYPHLDALWQTTLGPYRGILLVSPVLALAVPGFVYLWRQRNARQSAAPLAQSAAPLAQSAAPFGASEPLSLRQGGGRAETLLWLGIVGAYLLFSISYFEWDGGFSFGPRQFLPALPFVMLPIGATLATGRSARWRRAFAVLGAYSIAVVSLATATGALYDPQYVSPLTQWTLPRLAGFTVDATHYPPTFGPLLLTLLQHAPFYLTARLDNNWGMVFGLPGLLQMVPLLVFLGCLCLWHWRRLGQYSKLKESEHRQAVVVAGS